MTTRDGSDARRQTVDAASQRWAEVRAAAEAALALAPEARASFLDHTCGGDAALRAEVEAQVDACERAAHEAATFLAEPAAAFVAPFIAQRSALASADGIGTVVPRRDVAAERRELETALRTALAERYDVEREIGRGGTATVYLAHDRRHARRVALKVFDPLLGAALSAERFLREIRVTAGLTHPHILPLHDSGESAGLLYYVMPYVEGETLRERLARDRRLTTDAVVRLVREVASALDYAHRRGVVHRDIKPANILLADGHAVVADFGIARAVHRARETQDPEGLPAAVPADGTAPDTLTAAGTSPGTPAYMAPEQTWGDAVDARADLYALGVVAYEALAGTHPFGARTADALLAAHRSETAPPLATHRPDVPPALAALITQLLAKDPAYRPATAEAVLGVLERVPASPVREPAIRRRVAVASAVVVFALGVAGYAMWRRGARPDRGAVHTAPAIHSVAVLPFANVGGDRQDDFFSDGLTDELAHALAHVPGLRIAGRTSSYAFKGKAVAAREVGRALGVDAFLSATVRRAGDRLRVSPQLVSTADGTVLWDSVYESRAGDVFAVEDSLTRAVVTALVPTLGNRGAARGTPPRTNGGRGTTDTEAYELYLKGRYYWLERGRDNVTRAVAYLRQAVARDSMFARAHAGLAMAYSVLPVYVPDPTDSTTALLTASATRALALDSTLADAQLALALAYYRALRFREAEARYRAALAVDPSNVSAHQGLGLLLLTLGRTDEGLVEERYAEQIDPLAKSVATAHALALLFERRFAEAEAVERRAFALDSTFPLAFWGLGLAQTLGGQPDSAVRTLERGIQVRPETPGQYSALVLAYAAAGRWSDAQRFREQLHRPGGDPSGGVVAAFADLVFGDREPLVRLLTTAAGQRRWLDSEGAFGCHPLLDPLWADARFRAAMRGLSIEACPVTRPWSVALGESASR